MEKEINIYKSKRKGLYLIAFFLFLAIIGVLLIHNTDKNVAGWSLIILGSLSLITGLYTYFDRRAQIIITDAGISVYNMNYELIEWYAILDAGEIWFRGQLYIVLLLNRSYKAEQIPDLWFYRLNRLFERTGTKAVLIKTSSLDINSAQILGYIKRSIVNKDSDTFTL